MSCRVYCGYRWSTSGPEDAGVHICAYPPDTRHPQYQHLCECGVSTNPAAAVGLGDTP